MDSDLPLLKHQKLELLEDSPFAVAFTVMSDPLVRELFPAPI